MPGFGELDDFPFLTSVDQNAAEHLGNASIPERNVDP